MIEDILHIKREEFRKKIGISQGYLGMVLIGKRGPSAELIAGLFYHYRGYLQWILTGEGETMEARQIVDFEAIPSVSEPFPTYGPDRPNIDPAVDLLAKILNSGDQVIIQALISNLHAFNRAVEKDRAQLGQIQELEKICEDLKNRLEILERKQSINTKRDAA